MRRVLLLATAALTLSLASCTRPSQRDALNGMWENADPKSPLRRLEFREDDTVVQYAGENFGDGARYSPFMASKFQLAPNHQMSVDPPLYGLRRRETVKVLVSGDRLTLTTLKGQVTEFYRTAGQ
jgi:hypothetical protein